MYVVVVVVVVMVRVPSCVSTITGVGEFSLGRRSYQTKRTNLRRKSGSSTDLAAHGPKDHILRRLISLHNKKKYNC